MLAVLLLLQLLLIPKPQTLNPKPGGVAGGDGVGVTGADAAGATAGAGAAAGAGTILKQR